jgi:hypothetical protein
VTAETGLSPEYSRPVPSEWGDLVSVAYEAMVRSRQEQPTPEAIVTVFNAVEALDNESFDSARYYGLGLVMCGMARALQNPTTREDVTRVATSSLLGWARNGGPFNSQGVMLDNIGHMNVPFIRLPRDAYRSLPRWESLVSDVLDLSRAHRALQVEVPDLVWPLDREYDIQRITEDMRTAETVGGNATSATASVIHVALEKLRARAGLDSGDEAQPKKLSAYEETIGPVLPSLTEQQTALQSLALRCAVLRTDEFLRDLDDYIDLTPEGTLAFRRDRKVPSRELVPPVPFQKERGQSVVVLHNRRLKCPAVYIEVDSDCSGDSE